MLRKFMRLLPGVLIVVLCALCAPPRVLAQTAPNLNSEAPYAIVSSTFTNSNTGPQTIVNGQVCFTTGPVTPPVLITGAVTTPCPVATGVDQGNSLAFLNSQACTSLGVGAVALNAAIVGANPPGTFPPGCYSSGGAMNITLGTTVTLSGAGVYIFRPGGALTTGADSVVTAANGACANDVFWAPIGATTLGANSAASLVTPTFIGSILDAAGITIGHFAHLEGRALAFGGTVTTDANTITVPTCSTAGLPGVPPVPTLTEWAMIALSLLLALAGALAMRARRSQAGPPAGR
jgi:hypothetical protein